MIDKKTFKLSIIIPCYNEKDTIGEIIKRIDQSLNSYELLKYEILIVDDFSNDGTKETLKNWDLDGFLKKAGFNVGGKIQEIIDELTTTKSGKIGSKGIEELLSKLEEDLSFE